MLPCSPPESVWCASIHIFGLSVCVLVSLHGILRLHASKFEPVTDVGWLTPSMPRCFSSRHDPTKMEMAGKSGTKTHPGSPWPLAKQ